MSRGGTLLFMLHLSVLCSIVHLILNHRRKVLEHRSNMSSLVDAVINSDNLASDHAPSAELEQQKRRERQRMQRGSSRPRSSSRPGGPPSESAGSRSDIDGLLDDDVVAAQQIRRRRGAGRQRQDIPRMVDSLGENVSRRFQDFLEKYASCHSINVVANVL